MDRERATTCKRQRGLRERYVHQGRRRWPRVAGPESQWSRNGRLGMVERTRCGAGQADPSLVPQRKGGLPLCQALCWAQETRGQ